MRRFEVERNWCRSFEVGLRWFVILPGPSTLDLELQGQAKECTNQDDEAEDDDVVEAGMYHNSPNDVTSHKELETVESIPYPDDTGE
jgi:hypothetical protein